MDKLLEGFWTSSLYEGGLSSLFVEIALEATRRLGVDAGRLHLDATSFHLHGRYPGQQEEEEGQEENPGGVVAEKASPEAIRITRGYSRDHRPDLKQFVVDLLCSGDGGIPLFFRAADGNDSDAATFTSLISEFREQVDLGTLFVADAALYGEQNLQSLRGLRWVSRVPQTIKEARAALEGLDEQAFHLSSSSGREGYRLAELNADYAGVAQRWVIVSSETCSERMLELGCKRSWIEKELGLKKSCASLKGDVSTVRPMLLRRWSVSPSGYASMASKVSG